MAHARVHEWINSIGVMLAVGIAAISLYYSSISSARQEELVAVTVKPRYEEVIRFSHSYPHLIFFPFSITIANKSASKLSIVDIGIYGVLPTGSAKRVLDADDVSQFEWGKTGFPLVLDGGEATTIIGRVPFEITDDLANALAAPGHDTNLKEMSATDFASFLLRDRNNFGYDSFPPDILDIAIVSAYDQKWSRVSKDGEHGVVILETGRGARFFGEIDKW